MTTIMIKKIVIKNALCVKEKVTSYEIKYITRKFLK